MLPSVTAPGRVAVCQSYTLTILGPDGLVCSYLHIVEGIPRLVTASANWSRWKVGVVCPQSSENRVEEIFEMNGTLANSSRQMEETSVETRVYLRGIFCRPGQPMGGIIDRSMTVRNKTRQERRASVSGKPRP